MGSNIEINDTLQLSSQQGFPVELSIDQHLQKPYELADVAGKVFKFANKSDIRIYKIPPVRNFFVENKNGKWIYWGLVHVLSIEHDYKNRTTSGTYQIIHINNPEQMRQVFALADQRTSLDYFA